GVLAGGDVSQDEGVQEVVVCELGIGWLVAPRDDAAEGWMLEQLDGEADHLAHATAVKLLFHETVVEERLHSGVGGLESQLAGAQRQVQDDVDADAGGD